MASRRAPTLLKLHDYVLSDGCYTVRLMLALLGLDYQRVAVDLYPGNATTPHGDIPVLEDGETVVRDPGLILMYLARTHDPSGRWLPQEQAHDIAAWLGFAAFDLQALAEARRVSVLGQRGDLAALNGKGRAALRRVEDHLTDRQLVGGDWLVGAGPTVADIAVFPIVMLSHDSGIGHEDYPAINLWQRRVRRLTGFVGMPGIPDYF